MSVVSRQRVLEIICEECAYRCKTEEVKLKCCFNYQAIATLPPADVKPVVRGEWIDRADERDLRRKWHDYRCSKCSYAADDFISGTEDWWCEYEPNFCPNCGADMRERSKK